MLHERKIRNLFSRRKTACFFPLIKLNPFQRLIITDSPIIENYSFLLDLFNLFVFFQPNFVCSKHKNKNPPPNQKQNLNKRQIRYKKTVQYDPSKSETFKALNEFEHLVCPPEDVGLAPVETRVFQPNRCVPGKVMIKSQIAFQQKY